MTDAQTEVEKVAFKDKLTIAQFTISAVLAVVGLTFTYVQADSNEKRSLAERQTKQFESFLTLSGECTSDDPNARARIRRVLAEYELNSQLGRNVMMIEVMKSCTKLIDERDAGPKSSDIKSTPTASSVIPPSSARPIETWVYLGTYKDRIWQTRYLSISKTLDPNAYTTASPGTFVVRHETGALNVRTGLFSPTGDFPPVTSSLPSGTEVKILNTWQWFDSGNWWAKVAIPKS